MARTSGTKRAAQDRAYVGRRVAKRFGGRLYDGTVRKFVPGPRLWAIAYDDGDAEEMESDELATALALHVAQGGKDAKPTAAPPPPAAKAAKPPAAKAAKPPPAAKKAKPPPAPAAKVKPPTPAKEVKPPTPAKEVAPPPVAKEAKPAPAAKAKAAKPPPTKEAKAAPAAKAKAAKPPPTKEAKAAPAAKAAKPPAAKEVAKPPPAAKAAKPPKPPPAAKKAQAPTQLEKDKAHVGRRVAKDFGGEVYGGTVKKFLPKGRLWAIVYDDGDKEEMEWPELSAARALHDRRK